MMTPSIMVPQPALITRLESLYLGSVRDNFRSSGFLLDTGRERIGSLLERNATVTEIGDAHFLGLAEHYLAGHGVSMKPVAAASVFTPFGEIPSREFDWVRKANPVRSLQGPLTDAYVGRFSETPSSPAHLFEVEGCRTIMPWDIAGAQFLYLAQCGLHLYHSGDNGNFKSRLPSLSFWGSLLNLCFGEAGARLCLASGEVPEVEYNELHRVGYHPVGLSFEKEYLEDAYVHPFLYAGHDAHFHALNWSLQVAPWRRTASAIFYKALRLTAPDMSYGPYADCLEWSLDPEVDKHETVLEAVTSTLGIFQHQWRRSNDDKTAAFFRNFAMFLPEIEARCPEGDRPSEWEAFKASMIAFSNSSI